MLSEQCINLMESLMEPSPNKRITVDDALLHTWLRPTYKSILQKLIAHEKRAYQRKTLPAKLVDQQEVVRNMTLNDATKKLVQIDKVRSMQSAMSTTSRSSAPDTSSRSARSTVSNRSSRSDVSSPNGVMSVDSQLPHGQKPVLHANKVHF